MLEMLANFMQDGLAIRNLLGGCCSRRMPRAASGTYALRLLAYLGNYSR